MTEKMNVVLPILQKVWTLMKNKIKTTVQFKLLN